MANQHIKRKLFLSKLGALVLSAVGISKLSSAKKPSSEEKPAITAKKEPRAVEQPADRV